MKKTKMKPLPRSDEGGLLGSASFLPREAGREIKPLFDNVLIKPLEEEEKTPSGIVLPETAKEKPQIGKVMAVGPGGMTDTGKKIPMKIKVGQKVVYKKWGGNEIKMNGEEWLLVEQKDILAIMM